MTLFTVPFLIEDERSQRTLVGNDRVNGGTIVELT